MRAIKISAAIVAFGIAVMILIGVSRHRGNTVTRIEREHALKLPASATNFICRGDAWMHTFWDCAAASAFEMSASDLSEFMSQITIIEESTGTEARDNKGGIFPMNPQYQFKRAWISGFPMKSYFCKSPIASSMSLELWQIDSNHIGVCLYTDWN